jgi:hypothetical protein
VSSIVSVFQTPTLFLLTNFHLVYPVSPPRFFR